MGQFGQKIWIFSSFLISIVRPAWPNRPGNPGMRPASVKCHTYMRFLEIIPISFNFCLLGSSYQLSFKWEEEPKNCFPVDGDTTTPLRVYSWASFRKIFWEMQLQESRYIFRLIKRVRRFPLDIWRLWNSELPACPFLFFNLSVSIFDAFTSRLYIFWILHLKNVFLRSKL